MEYYTFKPGSHLIFATAQQDNARLTDYVLHAANCQIDLSDVIHCDSAGLALLIGAKRLAVQKGKILQIVKIPKVVEALARFCGVETILKEEKTWIN